MEPFKICHNHHLNEHQFDSQEVLDACGLCFNEECNAKTHRNSSHSKLLCIQCMKGRLGLFHKEHSDEILSLDFILRELTKMILWPQKMAKDYLHRAAVALHKFQVIGEIREKIQRVEDEVQAEILSFLNETEALINYCSEIKSMISKLSEGLIYSKSYSDLQETVDKISQNIILNPEYAAYQNRPTLQKLTHDILIEKKKKNPVLRLIHKGFHFFNIEKNSENKSQKWEQTLRVINGCYEMFRDYAIKIVEACTVESSDDEDDNFQHNLAVSAKLYKKLEEEVKTKVMREQSEDDIRNSFRNTDYYHPVRSFPDQMSKKAKSEQEINVNFKRPKNMNISHEAQFSYGSQQFSSPNTMLKKNNEKDRFHRSPHMRENSISTPGKEITRLKNKFGEREKAKQGKGVHFAEDDGVEEKPSREAKRKKEKKLMFEKILGIYEKNYQDSAKEVTKDASESSEKKMRRFIRH